MKRRRKHEHDEADDVKHEKLNVVETVEKEEQEVGEAKGREEEEEEEEERQERTRREEKKRRKGLSFLLFSHRIVFFDELKEKYNTNTYECTEQGQRQVPQNQPDEWTGTWMDRNPVAWAVVRTVLILIVFTILHTLLNGRMMEFLGFRVPEPESPGGGLSGEKWKKLLQQYGVQPFEPPPMPPNVRGGRGGGGGDGGVIAQGGE